MFKLTLAWRAQEHCRLHLLSSPWIYPSKFGRGGKRKRKAKAKRARARAKRIEKIRIKFIPWVRRPAS